MRVADSIRATLAEYHGVEVTTAMANRMTLRITSNLLDDYYFDPRFDDDGEGVAYYVRQGLTPAIGQVLTFSVASERASNLACALGATYRISHDEETIPVAVATGRMNIR